MKMRTEYTCPLELVHDMIKGKWKPIILWRLRLGATSLAKLERDIDGITQKMLLEQLKELMDYGFVEKKSYEGYPLRVEYSLTDDMGMKILEALRIMQHIGIDYLKANGMEHILEEKGVVPDEGFERHPGRLPDGFRRIVRIGEGSGGRGACGKECHVRLPRIDECRPCGH